MALVMTFDPVNEKNIQKLKEVNVYAFMYSSIHQWYFYDVIKFAPQPDDTGDPADKDKIRWKSMLSSCPGHKGNLSEYSDEDVKIMFKWICINRHGGLYGKTREEMLHEEIAKAQEEKLRNNMLEGEE